MMSCKGMIVMAAVISRAWTVPGVLLDHPGAHGADVIGADAIHEAEKTYRVAIAKTRSELLTSFERNVETAKNGKRMKAGERTLLARRIEAERDAFRDAGWLPATPKMRDEVEHYRRTLRGAEDLARRRFEAAASFHREAGDRAAETAAIEAWEHLFLETADLEAFPDRWVSLFNGRNLNGWFVERGDPERWGVEAGTLVARGGRQPAQASFLLTKRAFGDFILSFEFQLARDSDSGLVLRAERDERAYLELNLRSVRETPSVHGALLWSRSWNARDGLQPRLLGHANGPWNRTVVESYGDLLRVTINGQLVHSTDLRWFRDNPNAVPGLALDSGHVGLQAALGLARFRDVKIRGVHRLQKIAGTGRTIDPDPAGVPTPGRFYRLLNVETGMALDVLHSSLNPCDLVQAVPTERPSQAWALRPKRDRFQMVNGNSNLLLNIPHERQEDGNGLIQWSDQNGAANELWTLVPEDRAFRITSTHGLAVIVNESGRVEMRTPRRSRNELWQFVPIAL